MWGPKTCKDPADLSGTRPINMAVVVKTVLGYHLGVGKFTTHFRTYFSWSWDVHWGYGIFTHGHIGIGVLFGLLKKRRALVCLVAQSSTRAIYFPKRTPMNIGVPPPKWSELPRLRG